VREKHCYLAGAGGWSWIDMRKKYCRAGAAAEQPNTVIKRLHKTIFTYQYQN